jgi:hypothetical protein
MGEQAMNRRDLIKYAATQTAVMSCSIAPVAHSVLAETAGSQSAKLESSQFELAVSCSPGFQCRLVHRPTGLVIADGSYSYSIEGLSFTSLQNQAHSVEAHGTTSTGLEVRHRFTLDPSAPWLEESITFTNRSSIPLDLHNARAGFVLPVTLNDGKAEGPLASHRFTAIPFRREPGGHTKQYADSSLSDILTSQFSSELWSSETTVTSAYAAEAWAWSDGRQGFVFSKFSPGGLEFALLDRVALPENKAGLRWGGIGIYRGNPEHGAWLKPGEAHTFGISRLTAFAGDWREGYYTFRQEMDQRGMGCPEGFDPPVHWNELYDNKLWWLPGDEQNNPEMRKKYYTLESMKEEAAKAKAIGCEALYMDPGWDTSFASKIWDEARLGSYKSFVSMLSSEYGLKSSLHTPLSGWCDPSSYPEEAHRLDRFGQRATWNPAEGFSQSVLCGASTQYLTETSKRLKKLGADGAAFFMFDGTAYHEACWDPNHGHQVPSRMEEHCQATCRLARMIHEEYPKLLIEMHDPAVGGAPLRACPNYYGYGHGPEGEQVLQALGFDTVWAFELMWQPMEDLLGGQAIALYYYNLAYSLPLYIHIDLRTDNKNALVFWWNASTCRHLGIGGSHPDQQVRDAQKQAMSDYRRLKAHFASGKFYGIDEQTHVHASPDGKTAVMNCFNLEPGDSEREIGFAPAKLGLVPGRDYRFSGDASFQRNGEAYKGSVKIPGHGHRLIEITQV